MADYYFYLKFMCIIVVFDLIFFFSCLQGVKKGQEESDLERIQDLFPGDALRLYDKDVLTMRMKGLMRKRSTTAARLQRALSAKRAEPEEQSLPKDGRDKRVFLLETPVQFTTVSFFIIFLFLEHSELYLEPLLQ